MGKFDNVKVGDTVMILVGVSVGYRREKRFWIPDTVERVTNTQFVVSVGKRYRKDDGRGISEPYYSYAKNIGDYESGHSGAKKIVDRSEEYHAFKKKIESLKEISSLAYDIYRTPLSSDANLSQEDLDKVIESMNYVRETLKGGK